MTLVVPALIEDALLAAARRQLPAELLGGGALTAAVIDRSRRYTSERERLAEPGSARAGLGDLAARALFFTVADVAKLHLPLAELAGGVLPAPAGFLTGPTLRVLDVGAGCGAMTLGLLTFLARRSAPPPPALHVTMIDQDAAALAIAAAAVATVARELGIVTTIDTRTADVQGALPAGPFDLVVAGSVLNELAVASGLADAMVAALAPGGVALIIEPALRATSRALHAVRDALIAGGRAVVLAPCTRREAPCPALADPDDWCHDHRPLTLPPRTRQLAHVTGLRDGDLKVAYLALGRVADAPPPSDAWRVVNDPHANKGKLELTLCGAPGWVPVRLLKRHRSTANRPIERARRGDVLDITPAPAADAGELVADTRVAAARAAADDHVLHDE